MDPEKDLKPSRDPEVQEQTSPVNPHELALEVAEEVAEELKQEKDVLFKDPNEHSDTITIKKWVFGVILMILAQTLTAIWWAATLTHKVNARDERVVEIQQKLTSLDKNVATALSVLADHGTQFDNLDKRLIAIDNRVEGNRHSIDIQTSDRFRRADWNTEKAALEALRSQDQRFFEEKFKNLERRFEDLMKNPVK